MGEGKGGMIWENAIETCIISYVKQIASPGSMHDTGCLGLVHWDDPEGWDGEGGGGGGSGWETHVHLWWIHFDIWQNQDDTVKLKKFFLFNLQRKKKKESKLWYIYTMEYYSAIKKNPCESVLRWMKLELIVQSEVSQKEKHQYCKLTHIYGI